MAGSKNLLLTLATGKKHKAILAETIGQMRRYADRHGLDFLACNEEDVSEYKIPAYAKIEVIEKALGIYKRVCFVDADVLISDKAPNIFDVVPVGKVGMFNEAPWVQERHLNDLKSWKDLTGQELKEGQYYNTGVMVFDNTHQIDIPNTLINHYGEQSFINQNIVDYGWEVFELDYKWNRMSCTWIKGLDPRDAYFIHFAGQQYPEGQGGLPKFIRERLKEWKANQFQGISKILIVTGGGMGNQVSTLPTIEEIMRLHPDSMFGIHSAYPEVFEHLASDTVEIFKSQGTTPQEVEQYSKDLQARYMYSRVISTHGPSPFDMTHMNSVDYHSLMALGRQLPFGIQNLPGDRSIDLPRRTICIHAGFNAWPSKNVPKDLYQDVLNELKKRGYTIAIIGKRDFKEHGEGYGAYTLVGADFDFMDAAFATTCEVIKQSSWLITNDSMPVHVSQFTDTNTLLISIAKHPDIIFNKWFDWGHSATGKPQWEVAPRKAFYYPNEKIATTNEWVDGMAWPTVGEIIEQMESGGLGHE